MAAFVTCEVFLEGPMSWAAALVVDE